MRYFVIFLILIGFIGTAFAVPAPLPEDDFRYSDHVVTGKIISSEIIIDPREDNSAATFYDTIIYKVKVEKWHKNPLVDDIITVYGTHFPNDVVPEPNWGVLEFEIGDIVYLYIDKTDDGLKFREPGSKLLYSKDSGKTEITLSALKQFKAGIRIDKIMCSESLQIILKIDGNPACVKLESIEKLRERGWTNSKIISDELVREKILELTRHLESGQVAEFNELRTEIVAFVLLEQVDAAGINLDGINLENISLPGADLQNATLKDANIRNADLSNADLQGSNLEGADLSHTKLWGVNLHRANLQNSNLEEVSLRSADLTQASLQNANLKNADLPVTANLSNADFSNAKNLPISIDEARERGALVD